MGIRRLCSFYLHNGSERALEDQVIALGGVKPTSSSKFEARIATYREILMNQEASVESGYRVHNVMIPPKTRPKLLGAQRAGRGLSFQADDRRLCSFPEPGRTRRACSRADEEERRPTAVRVSGARADTSRMFPVGTRLVVAGRKSRLRVVQQKTSGGLLVLHLSGEVDWRQGDMLRIQQEQRHREVYHVALSTCDEDFVLSEPTGLHAKAMLAERNKSEGYIGSSRSAEGMAGVIAVVEQRSKLDAELARHNIGKDPKQVSSISIKGSEYSLGDFTIRIGRIKVGSSLKREVFVEIEYKPCFVLEDGAALLDEFVRILVPDNANYVAAPAPPNEMYQIPQRQEYSSKLLAVQYVQHFSRRLVE